MTNFISTSSFVAIAVGRVMQTFGLAFLFLPINTLGFRDIPQDRTNYASALSTSRATSGAASVSPSPRPW